MIAEKSNWHSLHVPRLNPDIPWHAKYARAMTGSMPVRTRSLQTYLADKEPIDLLRMDLEGYEVEILRSVASLPRAQTSRMRILFETHPEFYDPVRNDMRSVLEQLCGRHAFRIEYLDYHYGRRGCRISNPDRTYSHAVGTARRTSSSNSANWQFTASSARPMRSNSSAAANT